jgi:hypothetical protein
MAWQTASSIIGGVVSGGADSEMVSCQQLTRLSKPRSHPQAVRLFCSF